MFRSHPYLTAVSGVYLAIVAVVTLRPASTGDSDAWLYAVLRVLSHYDATRWVSYQRVEFAANVFMFIPIGMLALLLLGLRHIAASVTIGVALTCVIEFVQKFIPGRVSDLSDIIANSTGTVIGVAIVTVVAVRRRHRTKRTEAHAPVR